MKKTRKKDVFLEKCKIKFGDRFDYSFVDYVNSKTPIKIKCIKHDHFFNQLPNEHLRGRNGCKKCINRITTQDDFIERSIIVHNNFYDYSKSKYIGSNKKLKIICPNHGEFEQLPSNHINGQGCPKCSSFGPRYNKDKFIEKSIKIHGNKYDYSKTKYIDTKTIITIICPIHGEFEQLPSKHLYGNGCKKCSLIERKNKLSKSKNDFINDAIKIHGNKYDYTLVDYINSHNKVKIICLKHGMFEQIPCDHLDGHGCIKCSSSVSNHEKDLVKFIENFGIEVISSSNSIIPPYQLDIYIPSHKIAFEYNGLYWHNELFVDKNYHLNKTTECKIKNIQL